MPRRFFTATTTEASEIAFNIFSPEESRTSFCNMKVQSRKTFAILDLMFLLSQKLLGCEDMKAWEIDFYSSAQQLNDLFL